MKDRASVVLEWCERLAGISEERGAITRPYGSPAMREVNDLVSDWMREAGMTVKEDAIGNLIGFYEGSGKETLVLGSHLDTVRDAGRYDGTLGVMVACVEELRDRGERLPYSVDKESVDAAIRVLGRFLALPELFSSSAPGESR